jgi:hypothetical protein
MHDWHEVRPRTRESDNWKLELFPKLVEERELSFVVANELR